MSWKRYVADVSKGDVNRVIAQKVGVTEPSVARWKTGATAAPDAKQAASFARAYGRPVLEAFLAAGFLTDEEASVRPSALPNLSSLTDEELLDEVLQRMKAGGEHGGDTAATKTTGVSRLPTVREARDAKRRETQRLQDHAAWDDDRS